MAQVHSVSRGHDMSRDTNFYYSFLVLPPRKRNAIIAVWDFCRAVDDAVDEVVPESEWAGGLSDEARAKAAARVASWREELAATYSGTPTTPQGSRSWLKVWRWISGTSATRRSPRWSSTAVELPRLLDSSVSRSLAIAIRA